MFLSRYVIWPIVRACTSMIAAFVGSESVIVPYPDDSLWRSYSRSVAMTGTFCSITLETMREPVSFAAWPVTRPSPSSVAVRTTSMRLPGFMKPQTELTESTGTVTARHPSAMRSVNGVFGSVSMSIQKTGVFAAMRRFALRFTIFSIASESAFW